MTLKQCLLIITVWFSIMINRVSAHGNKPGNGSTENPIDFTLTDTSGKIVSLHDFTGKFVIISMSAGWCKPCLAEVEPTKDLQQNLNDTNIVWLFVNFDKNAEDWAETRRLENIKGVHLWGKPESTNLKSLFDFNSLPYYIWINKDGTLAQKDCPRPSSRSARGNLNLYLK